MSDNDAHELAEAIPRLLSVLGDSNVIYASVTVLMKFSK